MNLSIFTSFETIFNDWKQSTEAIIPKIVLAILITIAFYFMGKLAKNFSLRFYKRIFKTNTTAPIIISIVVYFFFLFS